MCEPHHKKNYLIGPAANEILAQRTLAQYYLSLRWTLEIYLDLGLSKERKRMEQ